jgi:hypothetical protein
VRAGEGCERDMDCSPGRSSGEAVLSKAVVVCVSLALVGCSPTAKPFAQKPADVAQQVHEGAVVDVTPRVVITLRSVEPTGTEPFAILAAMVDESPRRRFYELDYMTMNAPDRVENEYRWDAQERTSIWMRTRSNGPHGVIASSWGSVSGVDADSASTSRVIGYDRCHRVRLMATTSAVPAEGDRNGCDASVNPQSS